MDDRKVLELLKAYSDITDPGYGREAYELWEELNRTLFLGKLKPGAIQWGYTPKGDLSNYDLTRNIITFFKKGWLRRSNSEVDKPSKEKFDYRFIIRDKTAFKDFLIHEMLHQKIHQSENKEWRYTVKQIADYTPSFKKYKEMTKGQEPDDFPYTRKVYRYHANDSHECEAWLIAVDEINDLLKVAPYKAAQPSKYEEARDKMEVYELARFPYFFREYFQEKLRKCGIVERTPNENGEIVTKVQDYFYPE